MHSPGCCAASMQGSQNGKAYVNLHANNTVPACTAHTHAGIKKRKVYASQEATRKRGTFAN
eukprot:1161491-Pelagomonas_calceolata.AAC.6